MMRSLRLLQTLGLPFYSRTVGQIQNPTPINLRERKIVSSPLSLLPRGCLLPHYGAREYLVDVPVAHEARLPHERFQILSRSLGDERAIKQPLLFKNDEREPPLETETLNGSIFDQLFLTRSRSPYKPNNKVTVVGSDDVGMATVFSLLAKGVTNDVSIIDFGEDKLKGELMDLQCGSKFLSNAKLQASKEIGISSDSKICVLTSCHESESGQKMGNCVQCNAGFLKAVVPQLLKYSPDAIILVAIDPVDVMSYLAWHVSSLPRSRVFGTGTNLYSATFRYLLADRLGLAPSACHGYIIGENGKSSVPVWSGVTVGGVHLKDLNPEIGTDEDPEKWQEIHHQVMQSSQQIRELKGYNSWASALSITDICSTILNDANCIRSLSTYVKGEHEIDKDIFMSLPCVVGSAGITDIIRQPLSSTEIQLLRKSAEAIIEHHGTLKIG